MGKNVAVFVDVANIFYAAKAAGVDIDYVTLLKSAIAGRDFVRAYAYTGLDPDNENQRNFHNFLARHDYKVVSKDIRKYGDGKVKANLDIELVVDMMKTARNLDVAIVVSGDGDFAPAIRAVQEMGVRVEVISFRGNTSSDLIDVADQFSDIIQLARVEKGSSRSGRRVADDGEDLSMTEVPDKLTEGTGRGRGRGTGRGRGRTGDAEREPVAASGRAPRTSTRSRRVEAEPAAVAMATGSGVGLVALPGEKLSKAAMARLEAAAVTPDDDETRDGPDEPLDANGDEPRRRRRRGGRGRGRGRGRTEGGELERSPVAADGDRPIEADDDVDIDIEEVEQAEARSRPPEVESTAPRGPRPGAFGSVWDSQIGQTRTPSSVESTPFDLGPDEDEPAIPEYLIAEQRRANSSGRGGRPAGRGGRGGGYNAAVDRERYGRGGGSGGINRYPDVSGRGGSGGGSTSGRGGRDGRRDDRGPGPSRPDRDRVPSGRSDEPWSEVPPEMEAMLRAQLAQRGDDRPASAAGRPVTTESAPDAEAAAPKRRTSTRKPAAKASSPDA
ncbi:MAG TPA: NYN domain-containing protein [Patescibacteria group bacterium]|nr:NYN domain-containing protein [Patescibacteria group bacterium]